MHFLKMRVMILIYRILKKKLNIMNKEIIIIKILNLLMMTFKKVLKNN